MENGKIESSAFSDIHNMSVSKMFYSAELWYRSRDAMVL